MTHSTYTFVLCYWDPAMLFVGLLRVDATAASAEHASREIEESKRNRGWLFSAFKAAGLALHEEDIHGVSIGEYMDSVADRGTWAQGRVAQRRC